MDIKKVVQLTNEQYEELFKNGQIEVNGEIKTKDDETIYVCPASESWAELNNKIDEALIKPNKILHNPYSIEELETIIARLREQYNETDSVVGFRCTMKQGQQLKVNPTYRMYLNETLREYDYTCSNDDEMISIVLFGIGQNINITEELIQFKSNIETYIEVKNSAISVEEVLYRTALLLTMLNIELKVPVYCEEIRYNKQITSVGSNAPTLLPSVKRMKFTGISIGHTLVNGNTLLEEANFDSVTTLNGNYQVQPFFGTSNEKLVLSFPNLLEIIPGAAYNNNSSCIFGGVKHLIIGEKVKTLAGMLLTGNCGTIELYCKDATNSLLNGNIGTAATVDYLYLCPDWNCGMSIAPVSGISKENITEIFTNLKDLTNESSKTLTIKKDLYESLDEATLSIATSKNWTIAFK